MSAAGMTLTTESAMPNTASCFVVKCSTMRPMPIETVKPTKPEARSKWETRGRGRLERLDEPMGTKRSAVLMGE